MPHLAAPPLQDKYLTTLVTGWALWTPYNLGEGGGGVVATEGQQPCSASEAASSPAGHLQRAGASVATPCSARDLHRPLFPTLPPRSLLQVHPAGPAHSGGGCWVWGAGVSRVGGAGGRWGQICGATPWACTAAPCRSGPWQAKGRPAVSTPPPSLCLTSHPPSPAACLPACLQGNLAGIAWGTWMSVTCINAAAPSAISGACPATAAAVAAAVAGGAAGAM